ncbi:hypothetical protein CCACVL1_22162 [Corchorus capsularis]|uniref:Uncharacterized protein n=1 Tax=Corchorus capsularis TaxID=210143 RepID=A0A1R3H0Q2_COCAP|nr:hypothetical protein CCACVL1_22162 [Corchorus capsularis]
MEGKTKTAIGSISMDKKTAPESDHQNQNGLPPAMHKKKKSANLFKAGLSLLRSKSRKSSKSQSKSSNHQADHDHHHVGSKFSWKGLVVSMRPMHLQGHRSHIPTLAIEAKPATSLPENKQTTLGQYHEEARANTAPFCPNVKESPSTISMSSYGSASDMGQYESPLSVLPDQIKSGHTTFWYGDDEEDDSGDEMIDAKAEQFIAQFYQQMRLQNMNR